jgi:hypothetical protein
MSFKFMKKTSNAIAGPASITSPELQIIEHESLKHHSSEPAPSSSALVEHKETYVNMLYPSTAASSAMYPSSAEIPPGTVESPDDDDDIEMMKSRTKKTSRGPFRLKQLSLMKSGSYKLKHVSPPPTELAMSPGDDKSNHLERQKSVTSSSRLKKLFMLSRADPSRKQQKDVSLKNLRHVLWQNVSLVLMWPAIGNVELLTSEIRGQRRMLTSDDALELGMKTAETQTELIDGSSPSSADPQLDFQVVVDELHTAITIDNNNQPRLNINSTKDIKDLRCIDDDASSGRRILFDSPETKL